MFAPVGSSSPFSLVKIRTSKTLPLPPLGTLKELSLVARQTMLRDLLEQQHFQLVKFMTPILMLE